MEIQGKMIKMGPPGRSNFIGKKCLKFLEPQKAFNNTVSIVPIIGQRKVLSDLASPSIQILRNYSITELF